MAIAIDESKITYSGDGEANLQNFDVYTKTEINSAVQGTSSLYDETATYTLGSYCIYNNTLYRSTTAITTPEPFTSSHWESVSLSSIYSNPFNLFNGFASTSDEYKNAVKGLHNGLYRGACLYDGINSQAGVFSSIDELYNAVHNNDFSKIYTGDYVDATITSDYGTENVRLVATDPDYYWRRGDTELTTHHILFVPEDALAKTAQMNSSPTTSGGYASSAMAKTVLPAYATALSNALGGHIISASHLVSNSTNTNAINQSGGNWTGASDNWGWNPYNIMLLSEVQVYGSIVWSQGYDIGDACQQLSYFKLRPDKLVCGNGYKATNRSSWWLSGVAGSTRFCVVSGVGSADWPHASASHGVRPLILFG